MIEEWFSTTFYSQLLKINNDELLDFSYRKMKESEGRKATNYGGWQSNDLDNDDAILQPLISEILHGAKILHDSIGYKTSLSQSLQNIWININPAIGANRPHIHGDSHVSGVYYVKVPKNSGNIVFPHPAVNFSYHHTDDINEGWTKKNSSVCFHTPQIGKIIFFPSWAQHYVEPNSSNEDRISIAFNTQVSL
jgi:uncharacterized protein (TIGR02466 family)